MRSFRRLCFVYIIVFAVITAALNIYLFDRSRDRSGIYRVEAKRLADTIAETGRYDLSDYPHLKAVFTEEDGNLYASDDHYIIIEAGGKLYRVEYIIDRGINVILMTDLILAAVLVLTLTVFLYIRRHILRPFIKLNEVPKELAKGNLAVPLPEEKSRYFGKFAWGVNMLRESIEDSRRREITMQKDRKVLLLSLSHDIKTPLSAIKLNAQALAKGIYDDESKRLEAAESISRRADEIESFVKEITKAASEDFMTFEVTMGEEFLGKIIGKIEARYAQQLELSGTELRIGEYTDCILCCDPDRLAECLQNLIENAIKYGDGRLIELRFDKMDGCELITVSNSGCTLEEKELTQIFESFHRGGNAENVRGNGLGLFICKRLMSLMNGEVYAEIRDGNFEITLVTRLA